jgi:hypothetical protein
MSARLHYCPECGCLLSKPRSPQDHKRFFALIRKAFEHWPECGFAPSDHKHLRAFLLVQAGYFDAQPVPIDAELAQDPHLLALARLTVEASVAAAIRDRGYAFPRFSAAGCDILRPKSINWETLDQKGFAPIREAVGDIIENTVGVTSDQLLKAGAA